MSDDNRRNVVEAWRRLRGDAEYHLGWLLLATAIVCGLVVLVGVAR